ncbi:MAG: DUF4174 domain-containing protein [Bacteroidota bacterium]
MSYSRWSLCILILLLTPTMHAQDFSSYRWENRLILLFADAEDNQELQQQLSEFLEDQQALAERKLLIFFIGEEESHMIFPQSKKLSHQSDRWKQFRQRKAPFELQLLGLDGGRKLRKQSFVSRSELYALIDGMPMRRAEIKAKDQK